MIKAFKATDNDYTSNGDIIIKPISAVITKNTEDEYIEVEAPLKYAEFLIQDNILIVDTLTGKKGYQIFNPKTGRTAIVKGRLIYQENQPEPADRGAVISYGKNLIDCNVSENWDDVVTKIIPIGYNEATLPEGYLSVTTPHQRVYEKTVEFGLSESIEDNIESLETAIDSGITLVADLQNFKTVLENRISACDMAVSNLEADISVLQIRYNALGTSEPELKEKAVIIAQISEINTEISSLEANKSANQVVLTQTISDLSTAQASLSNLQSEYSDLIITDLRSQAQAYLNDNIYPHINYDLDAHLTGVVEVGDTVKVKHERLNIDMLAYVTSYQYDCTTSKFNNIQFGTQRTTLKSKISGIEQNIKSVSDSVKGANSLLEQLANQFILKVDSNGKIGLFKLSSDASGSQILIKADNINIEGIVTANEYFKVLEDGSIEAVNGTFKGRIIASTFIGGAIESDNYQPNVSGMKIYLSDGTIDSKHFKVNSDGSVAITGGAINIETGSDSTSVITLKFGTKIMRVTPTSITSYNETTDKTIGISNSGSEAYIYFFDGEENVMQLSTQRIYMPNRPIVCSEITVGGYEPITPANKNNFTYPPSSHNQNISSITGLTDILNNLSSRISTLEGA
ncbi:MAG: hypothetical protein K0S76_427 [Herbinix sp.]|nr:hypothetical protein [Herbinix sp.]